MWLIISHIVLISYISHFWQILCLFSAAKSCCKREKKEEQHIHRNTRFPDNFETAFAITHTPIATQRAEERDGLLTVLVDFPAEVLLLWGVCRARQQEVGSGLGPGLLTVVVVVEEWVRAQGILVAVALVAVKARS